ncbi:MAG: GC-type dockerin domain-anchored protein [Planctomycetota bacterium]
MNIRSLAASALVALCMHSSALAQEPWQADLVLRKEMPAPGAEPLIVRGCGISYQNAAGSIVIPGSIGEPFNVSSNYTSVVWLFTGDDRRIVLAGGDSAEGTRAAFGQVFKVQAFGPLDRVIVQATLVNPIDSTGEAEERGSPLVVTEANDSGFWLIDGAERSLLAREGSPAPGLPGYVFDDPGITQDGTGFLSASGEVILCAAVREADAEPGSSTASGVWTWANGALEPLLVPGMRPDGPTGAPIVSASARALHTDGSLIVELTLDEPSGVATAIWRRSGGVGTIVLRTGDVLPGSDGVPLQYVQYAHSHSSGWMAVIGQFERDSSIPSHTREGVWRWHPTGASLVVRSGSDVPGIPGAHFDGFNTHQTVVTADGRVLLRSYAFRDVSGLNDDGAGVTEDNRFGLWRFDEAGGAMLGRASDPMPGIANRTIKDFAVGQPHPSGKVPVSVFYRNGGETFYRLDAYDLADGSSVELAGPWAVLEFFDPVWNAQRSYTNRHFYWERSTSLDMGQRGNVVDSGDAVFTTAGIVLRAPFFSTACLADSNGDGTLTPADFNAWVAAFNAGDPAADQNQDGSINPSDFNAWVINYNAGC